MIDSLQTQAEQLARLAYSIRTGLDQAEATVPAINSSLATLAALGVIDHQLDGPTIYCRPRGFSGDQTDDIVIYRAGLILPPGLGATVWTSEEHSDFICRPHGEPVDLTHRFVEFRYCPGPVRAMIANHASDLLRLLLSDVQLLGS